MAGKKVFALAAFLASLIATPVNAQRVLLLPGTGSAVNTFTMEPFAASTPLGGASGAFAVVPHPSGTRYFAVTRTNVLVTDESGSSVQPPVQIALPATAAAITPDGKKLLVAAGTASSGSLYIFNAGSGALTQAGAIVISGNPMSVVASMDSGHCFVLTPSGLTCVDLGTMTAGTTLELAGTNMFSSRVVLGPNGLLYVNADGRLYEINAVSMTIRKEIPLDAFPSPPGFSLDGLTALLANPASGNPFGLSEPGLLILDLKTYNVKSSLLVHGVNFSTLIPTNPNANGLYAVSSSSRKLYRLDPDLSGIVEASFPVVGKIEGVISAFTSSELPNSYGITGPKYLFVVGRAALYRIDLNPPPGGTGAQIVQSLPLSPPSPGGLYFISPSTNSTVVSTLQYGGGQVLRKAGISAPLVARAVDWSGRPISGAKVTFTPSAGSIVKAMSATNGDGYAEAIVKAPQEEGAFSVRVAFDGAAAATFSLRTAESGGGTIPGPAPGAAGMTILAGDGQVITGGQPEAEPLTVRVTGANGEPVAGAVVRYTIAGFVGGNLSGANCAQTAPQTLACETDTDGIASASFTTPPLTGGIPFQQTTVTASVAGVDGVPDQTVTFHETWTPAPAGGSFTYEVRERFYAPANMLTPMTVQAGKTLQGAIRARVYAHSAALPEFAVPNVGLMVLGKERYDRTQPTPAYCSDWIPLSGNDGTVTCDLVVPANTAPGAYPIYAIFGGATAYPLTLEVTPVAPPAAVPTTVAIVSGDKQNGSIGQALQPLVVLVKDQLGNPIPDTVVAWTVSGPVQLVAPTSATTGSDGRASTGAILGSSAGPATVRVTAGNASATFSLTARTPAPVLTANSFLNGASMQSGAGLAYGSIVAIKGEGLATGLTIPPGVCVSGAPDGNLEHGLPTQLAGISVQFSTQLAPIFAVCKGSDGTGQVNVQAPFELAPARITVMVRTGIGAPSEKTIFVNDVQITNAQPGIFEYSTQAAVALRPDGSVVSPANRARRGEAIRIFTTGLGPVLPAVKTNQPGYRGQKPFFATSVQLGGSGAPGVTAEYAQNQIGVFIVTFQVPADALIGDAVPLVVAVVTDKSERVDSRASSIPISD